MSCVTDYRLILSLFLLTRISLIFYSIHKNNVENSVKFYRIMKWVWTTQEG